MRFALADTVTVSLHFVCKTYLYSAPVGKWRNAPKGVFWFFHNYERLATVFHPPHPAGPLPLWGRIGSATSAKILPLGGVRRSREGGHKKPSPHTGTVSFLGKETFYCNVLLKNAARISGYNILWVQFSAQSSHLLSLPPQEAKIQALDTTLQLCVPLAV